jgi:hypothetical protein
MYVKMADEFEFFSNDCNNWNYNEFIKLSNRTSVPPVLARRATRASGGRGYKALCRVRRFPINNREYGPEAVLLTLFS